MQIAEALEQLEHVALDLRLREMDVWVVEETREIVVHVGHNHVQNGAFPALGLGSLDRHLFQLQDVVVGQHLQQLDFPQRRDGKSIFLVVRQDLLQREDLAGADMAGFMDFSKRSLAQLLQHFVFADL